MCCPNTVWTRGYDGQKRDNPVLNGTYGRPMTSNRTQTQNNPCSIIFVFHNVLVVFF